MAAHPRGRVTGDGSSALPCPGGKRALWGSQQHQHDVVNEGASAGACWQHWRAAVVRTRGKTATDDRALPTDRIMPATRVLQFIYASV